MRLIQGFDRPGDAGAHREEAVPREKVRKPLTSGEEMAATSMGTVN
jgi:hypothetical protein